MTSLLRKSLEEIVTGINQSSKYQAGVIDGHIYVCLKDGKVHGYTSQEFKAGPQILNHTSWQSFQPTKVTYATHIGKYNHMQATAFLHSIQEEPDHE